MCLCISAAWFMLLSKTNANNRLHWNPRAPTAYLYHTKNRRNQFDNNFLKAILRVLIICKFYFFFFVYNERECDSASIRCGCDDAVSFSVKSAVVGALYDSIEPGAFASLIALSIDYCRFYFQNSVIILCTYKFVCVCVCRLLFLVFILMKANGINRFNRYDTL